MKLCKGLFSTAIYFNVEKWFFQSYSQFGNYRALLSDPFIPTLLSLKLRPLFFPLLISSKKLHWLQLPQWEKLARMWSKCSSRKWITIFTISVWTHFNASGYWRLNIIKLRNCKSHLTFLGTCQIRRLPTEPVHCSINSFQFCTFLSAHPMGYIKPEFKLN